MKQYRKLTVYASGKGMMPDFTTLQANSNRRFIGWQFNSTIGHIHPDTKLPFGGYETKDEPEVIKEENFSKIPGAFEEYIKAVKDGTLLPADRETAEICNVIFVDPTLLPPE